MAALIRTRSHYVPSVVNSSQRWSLPSRRLVGAAVQISVAKGLDTIIRSDQVRHRRGLRSQQDRDRPRQRMRRLAFPPGSMPPNIETGSYPRGASAHSPYRGLNATRNWPAAPPHLLHPIWLRPTLRGDSRSHLPADRRASRAIPRPGNQTISAAFCEAAALRSSTIVTPPLPEC